ncbi:MAG: hypothetical protein HY058_10810 [Proteobacteria bacterium]|nr:hypothetical protein [Pseudomonadota bacterium]
MHRWNRAALVLLALASAAAPPPAGADGYAAGLAFLTLIDPVEGGKMPVVAAYPVADSAGVTVLGPYRIDAAQDAAPAEGRFPLIVVSHGTGGDVLGHHDSLTALARAGFIAATVQHPRDNYRDDSGFGTDLQTIGRPHHIVALIDGVIADARLGPRIDPTRIGMVGHSAGGYTTIVVIGGRPNFALRADYMKANPDDPLMRRAQAVGGVQRRPDLALIADPRVKAAIVMAPALGFVFDAAGLASIKVPLRIYQAQADEVLPGQWNAERLGRLMPNAPEYQVLPGAGHFVFIAPCSEEMARRAPAICTDPPGIDRAAIHARLNAEIVDFFQRTLRP